ncbi:hypothetical protein BPAE_0091g00300 [Botrytis paeoniae]|uniref:Uncharacterized protein n=1 Tax=Botrytis paeoniae TaxID=278948 RepID=A0A4Z1FQ10_9HELO|nr:hypothetical protein BPAE_0091g00300 [Botrytis paeoniae]
MCYPRYDSDADSDFGPHCSASGLGSRQELRPSLRARLRRALTALQEHIVNDVTTWKRVMSSVSPVWHFVISYFV